MLKRLLGGWICILFLTSSSFSQSRPNIIYIMSDDHDADAISAYNKTLIQTPNIDRLAREGVLFKNNFVSNSICGPVRATVITGQHSHKNGVIDNRTHFDGSKMTLQKLLQQQGYQTAMIGKWHLHSYPTGYDYWRILPGQGQYFNPRIINMTGDTVTLNGYATDVITDEAIAWLKNRDQSKPFLLHVHHKAPHRNFMPPLKYIQEFHNKTFPEPSTLYQKMEGKGKAWQLQTMSILKDMQLVSDLKVDPSFLEVIPSLQPDKNAVAYYRAVYNRVPEAERTAMFKLYEDRGKLIRDLRPSGDSLLKYKYQWYMQDYLACVASVDENIGRLLDYLDEAGLAKNTLVIYTGDQGMYLGENGWFDKRWMYDVSMQAPLLARWPGHIAAGSVFNEMTQSIDYAPTMLDAAGIKKPDFMQGISLIPFVTGAKKEMQRKHLYYHYYESYADHTVQPHLGVRGERYKLIYFYTAEEWELYDLLKDPHEQNNLYGSPAYNKVVNRLKEDLIRLRKEYDDRQPAGELN